MKTTKKLLSIFLSVLLVFSVSVAASAHVGTTELTSKRAFAMFAQASADDPTTPTDPETPDTPDVSAAEEATDGTEKPHGKYCFCYEWPTYTGTGKAISMICLLVNTLYKLLTALGLVQ